MTICLLVAMLVPMVAGAAPMTTNSSSMPKSFTTGAYAPNPIIDGISPTTGLPSTKAYRPVLAQISNATGARPHRNMAAADIVYEMVYWGPAHTRYIAVYNDNHPEVVGYLRSTRVGHMSVRQEWDAPYVFWGAQVITRDETNKDFKAPVNIPYVIKENNVEKQFLFTGAESSLGRSTPANSVLYTDSNRVSPHHALGNLKAVAETYWPVNEDGTDYVPKNHAFLFSSTNPTLGPDSAQEIHIKYDDNGKEYYPSYTYNASQGVYERWYCGSEQFDGETNERIVASNVIVQFADLSYYRNSTSRPIVNMVGIGVMDVFIGGKHLRGTWARSSINSRTVYADAAGNEITLLPGKTFIQVIPNSHEYYYVTDDGTQVALDFGADVKAAEYDPNEGTADMDKVEEGE